ncbi:hypothetical protein CYLTODRAFT_448016 [Cylindrobasidium torrendii FP15055 ss-10]|uniref:Uncharacterized protein n=1 Tax=Cylindrobasidium torrendii FP15055 ss-10 TaxID=1314674 RepID=A0A0D7BV23_9AGAR|nr:hypothetical protein CYLTODRAFT_448016 [Cylindrobasidium torrendii FP15055 ss-10]
MRTPVRTPTPPVRRKESRSPPSRSPSPPTPPRVVSRLPVRSAVHDPLEESGRGRGMFRGRGGRGAHYWARGRGARPFESNADRFPTRQPPTGPRQLMQDRMDVDPKPQPSRDRTPPPKTPPPQDTQMDSLLSEAQQDLSMPEQQSVPEPMPNVQLPQVDDASMQVDSLSPVVSSSLSVPAGSIIADKTIIEPEPASTVTSPPRSISPVVSPSVAVPQPIAPIPSLPAHIPRRISEDTKQPSPSPSPGPSSLPSPIHMSLPVRPDHARRRPALWTGMPVNPSSDSPMSGIEKTNGNTPTTPDIPTPRYETPSRIDPSIMRLSTPTVGTPRIESPRIPAGPRGNPRGRGGASGSAAVPHATIPYVHKYATNPRVKRDLAKIDATMKHIGELRENRNALKAALDGGVSVANVRIRVTSQMDGHGRRQDTEVTRDRVVWKGPDGEWSNTVFGYTNTGIETDKPTVRQSLNELKGMVLPKTEGSVIARKRAEWELEMTRMDLAAAETRRACAERLMEAAKLGVLGIEYGAT